MEGEKDNQCGEKAAGRVFRGTSVTKARFQERFFAETVSERRLQETFEGHYSSFLERCLSRDCGEHANEKFAAGCLGKGTSGRFPTMSSTTRSYSRHLRSSSQRELSRGPVKCAKEEFDTRFFGRFFAQTVSK